MGRAESPLPSGDDRLLAFAEDLRRLRRSAGAPSYRELAQRVHYSASALSQAANGKSMPTLAITLAFVRGCGGDEAEWEKRWQEIASAEPAPSTEDHPVVKRRRWRWLVVAGAVAAVLVTALIWRFSPVAAGSPASRTVAGGRASPSVAGAAEPIRDGSDPNRAGCGPDAVTMASTLVKFPASVTAGTIELRYSPHCEAAWARFTPDPAWSPGPGVMVTIFAIRPADQATRQFTAEFGGLALFGDMLMTAEGCIAAEATVTAGSQSSPVATTPCWVFGAASASAAPAHG